MKLAIRKITDGHGDPWFVGHEGVRVGQRLVVDSQSSFLATWATYAQAVAYALTVIRLRKAHPDRTDLEIRERARQIVRHG